MLRSQNEQAESFGMAELDPSSDPHGIATELMAEFFSDEGQHLFEVTSMRALVEAGLAEVVAAIKATPLRGAFDVKDLVIFDEGILRTKTLKVFDKSMLVFGDMLNHDFIAIAAEELIIDNPRVRAVITKPTGAEFKERLARRLRGANSAQVGRTGRPGSGHDEHGHGRDGEDGGEGGKGGRGQSQNLPPVFIFVQRIRLGSGTQPDQEPVSLYFDGYDGGAGGFGGPGGRGGDGSRGDNGSDGAFDCKRSGGRGGDGGYGGRPGRGGDAGTGGKGASVFFLAPLAPANVLKFFSVRQEGGDSGDVGVQGRPGVGGLHGEGGHGTFYCGSAGGGIDRRKQWLRHPDGGSGSPSSKGRRGEQDYITRDNTDLFDD